MRKCLIGAWPKLIVADAAGSVTISRRISKAEFVPLVEKHSPHAIRGS